MLLNRRTLSKATIFAPLVLTRSVMAQATEPISPIDTGEVIVKSISPDGATLMGVVDREIIAFLDAETLEEISRTEPVTEIKILDELSIAWSPDSSKIAFSLDAWKLGRDSDIFIVEAATGTITNVTAEGDEQEAPPLFGDDAGDQLIDMYPLWMTNDTILFGRHRMAEQITCVLTTLTLSSGEVDNWASLHDKGLRFVAGPLHPVGENRVMMWMTDEPGKPVVAVVSATGEAETLNSVGVPFARLVDADKTFAYLTSADSIGDVWRTSMDDGEEQPLYEVLGLEPFAAQLTYPACGPEPGSFALIARSAQGDNEVLLFDGTESTVIATLDDFPTDARCHWVEGRLLITNRGGSYLVDIEG